MNMQDLKLYGINIGALGISFTDIELILKILLLIATLGYTLHRWYIMYNEKNK